MSDYLLLGGVRLSVCSLSPLNEPLVTFTQTMTTALTDRFPRFSAWIELNRMLSDEYKSCSSTGREMRTNEMLIYQDNWPLFSCWEDNADFNSLSKHLTNHRSRTFHSPCIRLRFNSDYRLYIARTDFVQPHHSASFSHSPANEEKKNCFTIGITGWHKHCTSFALRFTSVSVVYLQKSAHGCYFPSSAELPAA